MRATVLISRRPIPLNSALAELLTRLTLLNFLSGFFKICSTKLPTWIVLSVSNYNEWLLNQVKLLLEPLLIVRCPP